jgi:hypothetical protein
MCPYVGLSDFHAQNNDDFGDGIFFNLRTSGPVFVGATDSSHQLGDTDCLYAFPL